MSLNSILNKSRHMFLHFSPKPFWLRVLCSAGIISMSSVSALLAIIKWHETVDETLVHEQQNLSPVGFHNDGEPAVWTVRHYFQMAFPVPCAIFSNMYIIRSGSGLIIYNPCHISSQTENHIKRLGYHVNIIIVANNDHMKFVNSAARAFPHARVLCPPRCRNRLEEHFKKNNIDPSQKKIHSLSFDLISEDHPACQLPLLSSSEWDPETLEYHTLRGFPWLDEIVLFHKPSRLLIGADVAFNFRHSDFCLRCRWAVPFAIRYASYLGIFNRLSVTPSFRYLLQDKEAVRKSIRLMCDGWSWEGIGMAHGHVVPPYEFRQDIRRYLEKEWEKIIK